MPGIWRLFGKCRLDIKEADLPSCTHRLRMSIKDVEGNPNERDVVIKVVKK